MTLSKQSPEASGSESRKHTRRWIQHKHWELVRGALSDAEQWGMIYFLTRVVSFLFVLLFYFPCFYQEQGVWCGCCVGLFPRRQTGGVTPPSLWQAQRFVFVRESNKLIPRLFVASSHNTTQRRRESKHWEDQAMFKPMGKCDYKAMLKPMGKWDLNIH